MSLEPCELLTEEEWVQEGLTPWIDDVEVSDMNLVHIDGTQDEEAMLKLSKLEEPLHLKTTFTGIIIGRDVRNYPNVPLDWYKNTEDQTRVVEEDWKYVDVKSKP